MLIGEVSRQVNIPIETLRYYDRIGLICPGRVGGVRRYSDQDVQTLTAVVKMKSLMFSLEEIQTILAVDAEVDKSMKQKNPDLCAMKLLLEQIQAKYREVRIMEQNIAEVKQGLAHLVAKINDVLKEAEQNE